MDDWWSDQEREGPLSFFAEHQTFTSNHSISKYITSKFLSTHIYLYRLHCKMDTESSLRGGFRQQHHSTSRTSYRIMGVSYRQTLFGHGCHGFGQSLHHCVLDMCVCVCVCVCVWIFLWRVRLQRGGQRFAAKCFIFRETHFFKLHELHLQERQQTMVVSLAKMWTEIDKIIN